MRLHTSCVIALLLASSAYAASSHPSSTVVLGHNGQTRVAGESADTLRKLGIKLLESSNFNTVSHPRIMGLSIPTVQSQYREVVARDCMVITFDRPVKIRTVGGDVSVFEIVIGLGRPDYANALFTIDNRSRVASHGKYSGAIGIELRKAVPTAASAP
jgi:hypothetical protein